MIGKIFITRQGYDPQLGKHVKDPYLGETPSLGACRPDIGRSVKQGDHIFTISGKVKGASQFVMGGFEVARKILALEAFSTFPDLRLRTLEDGQLTGNIIVDELGRQHNLDNHKNFDRRIQNYVVGTNLIAIREASEIQRCRVETLEALQEIFKKKGTKPIDIIGHYGCKMTEVQVHELRKWLTSLKVAA